MWRFIALVLLLLGLLAGGLYLKGQSDKLPTGTEETDEVGAPNKIKQPLAMSALPTPRQPTPAAPGAEGLREPILISGCTLLAIDEQQVASRADGKLQEHHAKMGAKVSRGQSLGQMDEKLAQLAVDTARVKAESSAGIETARHKEKATLEMYRKELELSQRGGGTPQDLLIKEFQWRESQQELVKAIEENSEAKRLLAQKKYELELMKLTSDIDGVVVKINKRPGWPVRAQETVYEVVNTDRLWVEILAPREAAAGLRAGMRVRLEPERLEAPVRELHRHTAPVTGLALSPDSRLLVSCGEDGKVVAWDWRAGRPLAVAGEQGRLIEFLAVAFSPTIEAAPGGGDLYRVVIGGADGVARLWTLRWEKGQLTKVGMKELKKDGPSGHTGHIQAVAFAPDGKHVLTGGTEGAILLWNVETGAFVYKVQARAKSLAPAHRGYITSLAVRVDPQTQTPFLISAGTDKTIRRWKLGVDGAELVDTFEGRTGDVSRLDVFPDGKRALFDHADELRVLNLDDGTFEGIMRSRHGQFRNLALVVPPARSPDGEEQEDALVLTTTAQGRLQLVTVPAARERQDFFRHCSAAGFRKNSLLILGDLTQRLSGGPIGLNAALASAQPKAPPLPSFRMVPGFPAGAAPFCVPVLAADLKDYEGLAAVPELWNLSSLELRNLKTPDGAAVTCGACAPSGGPIFTAGTDRVIRIWDAPGAAERQETFEAVLTYVGAQTEATSTPLVRIRAELDNPQGRLMPNTKANMTIYPEAAK